MLEEIAQTAGQTATYRCYMGAMLRVAGDTNGNSVTYLVLHASPIGEIGTGT